jgi:hypothetical protein
MAPPRVEHGAEYRSWRATERLYERGARPMPKLGAFAEILDQMLADDARRARRERLTFAPVKRGVGLFRRLRCGVALRPGAGATLIDEAGPEAYVPRAFAPGEAYQFDWSHECVVVDGVYGQDGASPPAPPRRAGRGQTSGSARSRLPRSQPADLGAGGCAAPAFARAVADRLRSGSRWPSRNRPWRQPPEHPGMIENS